MVLVLTLALAMVLAMVAQIYLIIDMVVVMEMDLDLEVVMEVVLVIVLAKTFGEIPTDIATIFVVKNYHLAYWLLLDKREKQGDISNTSMFNAK